MKCGNQKNDLKYINHNENKMPRAKKTKALKPRKKTDRRKSPDRRRGSENIFWAKVSNGFKKLLESPFKK